MKLLFILLIPLFSQAKVCDVKIDGIFIGDYHSSVCDKSEYGGKWGSKKAVHLENTAKTQAYSDVMTAEKNKRINKKTKLNAIKPQCSGKSGLLKDLCDYVSLE